FRAAVWTAPLADWHGLRPIHQSRPRRDELRVLSVRALHHCRHAVRDLACAGRRRAPIHLHAADRYWPTWNNGIRAGIRRRTICNASVEPGAFAGGTRRVGVLAPVDTASRAAA